MGCRYFVPTHTGYRCAFLGPSEWRIRSDKLLHYCRGNGNGCPVLSAVLRNGENMFLYKLRSVKGLKDEG